MPIHTVQGQYITLAQLEDVSVTQPFPPPAIGITSLIEGARGQLIATRVGTPHLMGFMVEGGQRFSPLHIGMKGIEVSGRSANSGEIISFGHLECLNTHDPAIFLQHFP